MTELVPLGASAMKVSVLRALSESDWASVHTAPSTSTSKAETTPMSIVLHIFFPFLHMGVVKAPVCNGITSCLCQGEDWWRWFREAGLSEPRGGRKDEDEGREYNF